MDAFPTLEAISFVASAFNNGANELSMAKTIAGERACSDMRVKPGDDTRTAFLKVIGTGPAAWMEGSTTRQIAREKAKMREIVLGINARTRGTYSSLAVQGYNMVKF